MAILGGTVLGLSRYFLGGFGWRYIVAMGSSSCWESCEVTTTVQAGGGALDLFLKNECSDSHVDRNRAHRYKPAQKARDAPPS